MLHFFDIVGGDIVIHADLLAIPCFEKLWNSDNSINKEHTNKIIKFIVFCDYWDSPYVKSISDVKLRESKLKTAIFKKDYKLTVEEQCCRDEWNELLNTRSLKMLTAIMNKLDTITDYYESSLEEGLDEKKIQVLLAGMEKVKGVMQTIDFLTKAVKADELENTKVRGNAQVNPYEIVK